MERLLRFHLCVSVHSRFLPLAAFKISRNLIMMCIGVVFTCFFCSGFIELPGNKFSLNLGNFLVISFQILPIAHTSFLEFNIPCVILPAMVLLMLCSYFIFFSFFLFHLRKFLGLRLQEY